MFEQRNIKRLYIRIRKQTKDFLLSDKSREFFVFLVFFFIAAGFWLLQTLNNDYETDFSVPVRLKNVPEDVVITSEPVSELRVRVRDKGTVLLNYMLGKSFYPVTLDFSEYKSANTHVKILTSQIQKKVTAQLNASTTLLSMKPDTLEYYYSTGESKWVPVRLQGRVEAGLQYYLPDTVFTPDSVRAGSEVCACFGQPYAAGRHVYGENGGSTFERHQLPGRQGAESIPFQSADFFSDRCGAFPSGHG